MVLCFCFTFGINVLAEDFTDNTAENPPFSEEKPMQEGRGMRGGGGGMGEPRRDNENMKPGEPPEMPEGDMKPPEFNENNDFDNSQKEENNTEIDDSFNHNEQGNMPGMRENIKEDTVNTEKNSEERGFLRFIKTYSTPVISLILLALAFVFVIFYKRKKY